MATSSELLGPGGGPKQQSHGPSGSPESGDAPLDSEELESGNSSTNQQLSHGSGAFDNVPDRWPTTSKEYISLRDDQVIILFQGDVDVPLKRTVRSTIPVLHEPSVQGFVSLFEDFVGDRLDLGEEMIEGKAEFGREVVVFC